MARPVSQLQDGPPARLPQRDQERAGPQACPVQVIARLQPLPEKPIPELSTCMDHTATLRRTPPDRSLFAAGIKASVTAPTRPQRAVRPANPQLRQTPPDGPESRAKPPPETLPGQLR
jgi:hypothetical protein